MKAAKKGTKAEKAPMLSKAHQIFYDETGIEISIRIDRALKTILLENDKEFIERLEKILKEGHGGGNWRRLVYQALTVMKG